MARHSYPVAPLDPPPVRLPPFLEGGYDLFELIRQIRSYLAELTDYLRKLALPLNNAVDGKLNSLGDVTLTANVATTTLSDRRIGPESCLVFMPTTANAATGLTALYVTGRGDSTLTLNHANNAQTDRTYVYAILG